MTAPILAAFPMTRSLLRALVLALCAFAFLGGCASKAEKEKTERELYVDARKQLDRGNFMTAQTRLQDLDTRFPFGRFSEQAQLDMLYAQVRALDYPAAVTTAQRFLRQHPGHPNSDYVLYLRGVANYWLDMGVLERRTGFRQELRDLSSLREAFADFSTLVTRYPDSPYAPDARARMLYVRNLVAAQEIQVAWYYVRRDACVAALERAGYVLAGFPTAPVTGDALVILAECSDRLGERDTAAKFVAVLKANFPAHPRLRADGSLAVPEGRHGWSWLRALSLDLLD